MFKRIFIVCAVLALFGSGCQNPMNPQSPTSTKAASSEPSWENVAPDISRYECGADVCGARLIIYRFAKDKFAWRFENRAAPSTVEAWANSLPQAVFITNGVFFNEKWQPTGLLKTSGALANDLKYDLGKSGLLELSPAVAVIDTAAEKINLEKITEAAQSFPLLIKNGIPITSFKDQKAARRTFIGTDKNGDIYIGAVPEDAITFVDLAKLLAKTDVAWNNVLNLDGGTSTGFSVHAGDYEETMNSIVQVPNVIVAERK
jgi:Exopolysaccharide biosynthesis protein related to N-acetylglucosamine-1-phosphodiester alpha-N-acetylglucosaminidase